MTIDFKRNVGKWVVDYQYIDSKFIVNKKNCIDKHKNVSRIDKMLQKSSKGLNLGKTISNMLKTNNFAVLKFRKKRTRERKQFFTSLLGRL